MDPRLKTIIIVAAASVVVRYVIANYPQTAKWF